MDSSFVEDDAAAQRRKERKKRSAQREQIKKERWQKRILWAATHLGRKMQSLPRAKAMSWAAGFGKFASRLAGKQRQIALANLRLAQFPRPDATDAERAALVEAVFVHFAKVLVDFLRGPTLDNEKLIRLQSIVTDSEGFEHIRAAQNAGEGVILLTAHLGNWELQGRFVAANGVPLTVVAREPENKDFGSFVRQTRESGGFAVLPKGASAREIFGRLKKGEAVGLLPDQNSGDLFAPFFGVPCGTVAGPASFALRTGAALIPTYCVRKPDDTYKFIALPPIETVSTGEREADIARITTEINRILEQTVRQYPEQWLWLHNRWKSAFEDKNHERAWPPETMPNAREKYQAAWERWNLLPFVARSEKNSTKESGALSSNGIL